MGYLFRVRMSSFFAGAAVASGFGFYFLYKDYRIAQEAISQQVSSFLPLSIWNMFLPGVVIELIADIFGDAESCSSPHSFEETVPSFFGIQKNG